MSNSAFRWVIAYATEAVFGLGCDPDNEAAVHKLLQIKLRPIEKGLILIAAEWQQLIPYLDVGSLATSNCSGHSIPGLVLFIHGYFPPNDYTQMANGEFSSLAVRVSAHPQVRALCQSYGKPLVSTSANLTTYPACRTEHEVRLQLGEQLTIYCQATSGLIAILRNSGCDNKPIVSSWVTAMLPVL